MATTNQGHYACLFKTMLEGKWGKPYPIQNFREVFNSALLSSGEDLLGMLRCYIIHYISPVQCNPQIVLLEG